MNHSAIRILIAEDDADDLFLLRHALALACSDAEYTAVRDGVELLAYLQSCPQRQLPQVMFIDLNMPRMDGRDTLRAVQKNVRLSAIPVVVMTTSKEPEEQERAKDIETVAWITKPDHIAALVAAVRSALDRARLRSVGS
jgi:two-component system response regulator